MHIFTVTSVSSGSIEIGGMISGHGITPGSQIINQRAERPAAPDSTVFSQAQGLFQSETMTETYGVLTVGAVNSGTVARRAGGYRRWRSSADGDRRQSERQRPRKHLDCQQRPDGRGREHDNDGASPRQLQCSLSSARPKITTFSKSQPNGYFGFDHNPSSLSYMSGTAAAALGLTQASGAINSTPGGQHPSTAHVHEQRGSEREQPVRFVSDATEPRPGFQQAIWRLGLSRLTVFINS